MRIQLMQNVWIVIVFAGLCCSDLNAQDLDFAHDIVPILRQHCVECHGGREAKGSFSLNTRELWIGSGHLDLDQPADSRMLELVRSTDTDDQMPPKAKPRLSDKEIGLLERWVAAGAPWEAGFSFAPKAYEPPLRPRRVELPPVVEGRTHPIDRILDQWMASNQVQRPVPVSDAAFLRRVRMDLTGLLPDPAELEEFLADASPTKRLRKIETLLEDNIAYADHWLSFYNDLLRNDYSGTGFITGGRKQISKWLYEALVSNRPFDAVARELIAPTSGETTGYIDGIKWRGEVSAGQTIEIQFAQSVAQSFLGINLKCASCHDSFIDRWKLDEAYGLAAVYSERELDIHRCDKPIGRKAQASWLFPDIGQVDPVAPKKERLKQLAQLMTSPDNGRFSRTIVNRLWYRLMGRGIVHPLDAMQTEPWNADLLDYLAVYLSDHDYDLKQLLILIASSEAYRSRSERVSEVKESQYTYAGPRARRLTAEQFLDAIWQLTGAAPTRFDAPVFRALGDGSNQTVAPPEPQWIWGKTGDGLPVAGETLVFRKIVRTGEELVRGGLLISCDNEFTLFVNGRQTERGDNFAQLHLVPLLDRLRVGDNEIVLICKNAGKDPNAAGLFVAGYLAFENASPVMFKSDDSWEWSATIPAAKESHLGNLSSDFQAAVAVKEIRAWKDKVDPQYQTLLAQLQSDNVPMVRAALLKNTAFMRSLGRPTRDQIVSMRPTEMTTLEAIDLANEAELSNIFLTGAERLLKRFDGQAAPLIQHVFEFALSRPPGPAERELFAQSLGEHPSVERVQDMLWVVCMLPEFWLVQ